MAREFDVFDISKTGSRDMNDLLRRAGFPVLNDAGKSVLQRRALNAVAKAARKIVQDAVPVKKTPYEGKRARQGRRPGFSRSRVKSKSGNTRRAAKVVTDAPLWHILEFGRQAGVTEKGRRYPAAPAFPSLLPAINDAGNQRKLQRVYVQAFRRELRKYTQGNRAVLRQIVRAGG